MLDLVAAPGERIALRSLSKTAPAEERHFSDPAAALEYLSRHDGQRACYVVLNPLRSDAKPYVGDARIASLRWFPGDADPRRPADTASTDGELASARARMRNVLAFLNEHVPDLPASTVRALSGNGEHFLFRLPDYPPSEAYRLKRLGDALSRRFSDGVVSLDPKIYNPARMWRMYGTLNLKGDGGAERPHRRARLLIPPGFTPVPVDLLAHEEALLAALGAAPAPPKTAKAPSGPVPEHDAPEHDAPEADPDADPAGLPELPPWWGESVASGGRNNAAFRRARWLVNKREGGRDGAAAWALLKAWNLTCCRPSLDPAELRKAFDSAQRTGDNADYAAPNADAAGKRWEPPLPFNVQALPPFPVEALPPVLQEYVSEVAASSQVPPDMPAMVALAVVATAGGRRAAVQIGRTHREQLNIFVAVVMEPGSRKSAVMDMAAPLREHESALAFQAKPLIAAAREARAVEEKRAGLLREQAAKEKDGQKRGETLSELQDMAANMTEVPATPKLLIDNITTETVATVMAENAGAAALLSAEGGIFGILAGRYSKGEADLDVFLKGHAGDEIRVDRKSRPPEYIRRPALTMGLLVQPDVIATLADSPSFRGRGLLGRFLYSVPQSLAGTRMYQDRPVDPAAKARYDHAIGQILNLPSAGTEEDPTARHSLPLTGDALALWTRFADDVEARQAEGGDLVGIRDFASKLAGQVARIAGGFHLLERAGGDWQSPLTPESVAAAWAIGQYLIPHALAAFGQMGANPRLALARRIVRWIERSLAPDADTGEAQFTLRDCQRAHTGGGQVLTAEDVQAALLLLIEGEYLRPVQARRETGGRPGSTVYAVNPAVFSQKYTGK